jgi:predicted lipid carrier protein YhbT
MTVTLRIQVWAGPGNVLARKKVYVVAVLRLRAASEGKSECIGSQAQTPTVVTDVHLTFQRHKNKLVSYETHHRDKTICGDVQRLFYTEHRFGDGDTLCLRHQ